MSNAMPMRALWLPATGFSRRCRIAARARCSRPIQAGRPVRPLRRAFGHIRADDLPAYFTIFIVAMLVA